MVKQGLFLEKILVIWYGPYARNEMNFQCDARLVSVPGCEWSVQIEFERHTEFPNTLHFNNIDFLELLLAGTIDDMTIDKFISLMWRQSPVWDEVMEELYMYDYKLVQDNAKNIQFFSRLKMINFNIPMLNIPDHCEQTTSVSYLYRRESPMDGSRLGGSIKIQTETNADKFPFTDAFRIIQT